MSGGTNIELFIDRLSFPTSLTFDQESTLYVAESGLPLVGRLLVVAYGVLIAIALVHLLQSTCVNR